MYILLRQNRQNSSVTKMILCIVILYIKYNLKRNFFMDFYLATQNVNSKSFTVSKKFTEKTVLYNMLYRE